jgi:speckle-type POZ protein
LIYDEPSIYQKGLIDNKTLERSGYLKDDAFSVRCEFSVPMTVTKTVVVPPTEEQPPTHVPADVYERLVRFVSEAPTDVVLEVGDKTFLAHRHFLAAQSPVFAAYFTGHMRENTAPSVRIEEVEPQVFKAMLDFIYRGNLQLPPV